MSFAVIETGGKQYVVRKDAVLLVEKLKKPVNDGLIEFSNVLIKSDGKKIDIGTPYISGAKVLADYVEEVRAKKVSVLKYKSKTRQSTRRGHRHQYTKIRITEV